MVKVYSHERRRRVTQQQTRSPGKWPTRSCLGDPGAPITLVEYGSYNCPSCLAANAVIADLRDRFGDRLRYIFRHRPISGDLIARRGAELAQYAYETTGEYWPVHAALMKRGPTLRPEDFDEVAAELGLPPTDGPDGEAWHRLGCRRTSTAHRTAAAGCRRRFSSTTAATKGRGTRAR